MRIRYKYRCLNCGYEFIEVVSKESVLKKILARAAETRLSREQIEDMVESELGLTPILHHCGGNTGANERGICYPFQSEIYEEE